LERVGVVIPAAHSGHEIVFDQGEPIEIRPLRGHDDLDRGWVAIPAAAADAG
jgi:hypothetical protein